MAAHQTADQIVEREVREPVRRRGLDPADGDATAVRHLIDEVVADYQERSHTANLPLLLDLAQVAKSVADRVVGARLRIARRARSRSTWPSPTSPLLLRQPRIGADGWHRTVLCHLVTGLTPFGLKGLMR
jgi:hypothetical protein